MDIKYGVEVRLIRFGKFEIKEVEKIIFGIKSKSTWKKVLKELNEIKTDE